MCGSNGAILSVVGSVSECCMEMGGGAYDFPGAGVAIDCAPCSDFEGI